VLDVVEAVALRALDYPYKMWGFGEGMALLGLLWAAERCGRPEWTDAVAELVTPTLSAPPGPVDHLIAVDVLLELRRQRQSIGVRPAIERFRQTVWRDGVPVPTHRPDLPDLAGTVWVDCMHTDGPGLPPSAAAEAISVACARLQDSSGLFSHGFDVRTVTANGVHWGRGQGWALHGLIAVEAPAATRRLLSALAAVEEDGRWRTIADDPAAPLENSVSALVAAGIRRGIASGRVDPLWKPLAERALAAAVAALDGDGGLPVSAATPAGPPEVYLARPAGIFPWGQGPLLLALLEDDA
jgi:unsaturated rhamnogalacturonyl hydrolase